MHQTKIASVIGSPLESGWSCVVSSQNKKIFATLAVKGSNAKNIGFELVSKIERQDDSSTAAIHNLILDLLKKVREQEVSLHLAIIGFPQAKKDEAAPIITLAAHQGQIILKRQKKVASILKSAKGLQVVEGTLKKDDEFILATAQAEQLEQSILKLFKSDFSTDALTSNLNQKVQMLVDSSLFAMGTVKIQDLDLDQEKTREVQKVEMPLRLSNTKKPKLVSDIPQNQKQILVEKKTKQSKEELPVLAKTAPANIEDPKIKSEPDFEPDKEKEHNSPTDLSQTQPSRTIQGEEDDGDIKIKISLDPIAKVVKSVFNKIGPLIKNLAEFLVLKIRQLLKKIKDSKASKDDQKTAQDLISKKSSPTKPDVSPTLSQHFSVASPKSAVKKTTRFSKITKKISSIISRSSAKPLSILALPLKIFQRNKDVYLGKKRQVNSKLILAVAIIGLTTAIAVYLIIASINNQKEQISQELQPAKDLLAQAQTAEGSNIIQARDLASRSIEVASNIQKELGNTRLVKQQFESFSQEAQEYFTRIDGQIELSQLDVFFDLREVSPNFLTSKVASNSQFLFFLDQEQGQLVALNPENKNTYQLSLGDDFRIQDISASEDELFILNSGIYQASLQELNNPEETNWSTAPIQIKVEGDSDRDGIFIDFYESFLYVFNPAQRNIFRYIVRDDRLSEPIGWLTNKQNISFANINSMSIDGQIWLSDNEGSILQLERGEPLDFNIEGLDEEFGNSISIDTTADAQYLYILEPAKNRVVLLSKSGEFFSQINSPTIAATTQILVNENLQKAFVVSGSIVYQVDL